MCTYFFTYPSFRSNTHESWLALQTTLQTKEDNDEGEYDNHDNDSAVLRSRADSQRPHVILHEWLDFNSAFLDLHGSGVLTALHGLEEQEQREGYLTEQL